MRTNRINRHTLASMGLDALHAYFRPITYVFELFDKSIAEEKKSSDISIKYEASLTTLQVLQKAICFNQGQYLQYNFIAAEKHRYLKDAFRESPNDFNTLSRLTKELTDHINMHFYENAYENFKLLHAYFHERGKEVPRICIKGDFKVDHTNKIVSVFRDSIVPYNSDTEIEKNYGFLSIHKTGTYYLENDIPHAVLENKYYNPRLNSEKVKTLFVSSKKKNIPVSDWAKCWEGGDSKPSSCYKSTLIVPMTLRNNKVSEEFKKLINLKNVDRTIFGFLCFDHTEKNYFDPKNDVSVGYAFADIMSMYIFTRLIYMEISSTFSKVEDHLKVGGFKVEEETLNAIWRDMPNARELVDILKIKIKPSHTNDLFPLDSDLIKFAQSIRQTGAGEVTKRG